MVIRSRVNLICCAEVYDYPSLSASMLLQKVRDCSGSASGSTGTFRNRSSTGLEVLSCVNASAIRGRTWWVQYLVPVNMKSSKIDPGHMKRIPTSCIRTDSVPKDCGDCENNFPSYTPLSVSSEKGMV
ncbi:hypothetical protein PRIEUP_LOCUS16684 [Pristimantis euphronides]